MNYPVIKLRRGKDESLKRFHPWIFSGAIASLPEGIEEGQVVVVHAADGTPMGMGHYQIGSIAVRMLCTEVREIDADYYRGRLTDAYRLRQTLNLIRDDNNAYRLVHGEGDFLPGLIVDVMDLPPCCRPIRSACIMRAT